ncbi:hypothetical protein Mapa_010096 [Marchantia paleacea]|nr:hypothetical protein Mapa_010096 [Marchantia paleacea]
MNSAGKEEQFEKTDTSTLFGILNWTKVLRSLWQSQGTCVSADWTCSSLPWNKSSRRTSVLGML